MRVKSGDVSKLPKWAQNLISDLETDRDLAIRALKSFGDNQTESMIYTEDFTSPEIGFTRHYIQSRSVTIEAHGIEARVYIPMGQQGRRGIEISFNCGAVPGRYSRVGDIVVSPNASNSLTLRRVDKFHDEEAGA